MASHHHHEEHFLESLALKDLILGLSDGLTVPFALAAGLSAAVSSNSIIITAGLAEIAAGAIAMGLGGYLGGRAEVEHYESEWRREAEEVETIPEEEKWEVKKIFADYGLSESEQDVLVESLAQDKDKWVRFMMKFELGLEEPGSSRAYLSALRIGGGYVIGGVLPLVPYFWAGSPQEGLGTSAVLTLVCLFVFGFVKSRILHQPPWSGALKVAAIGAVAAAAAYFIAQAASSWTF